MGELSLDILTMVLQALSFGMCFQFEKWLSEEAGQEIIMFCWAIVLHFLVNQI